MTDTNRDHPIPPLPLAGYRVLDLSRILAGPYCTMILGDQGAEVIKVERPGTGDDTRTWGPPFAGGESAYYLCCNRNKRSIAVDLRNEKMAAIVRDLALAAELPGATVVPRWPYRFLLSWQKPSSKQAGGGGRP